MGTNGDLRPEEARALLIQTTRCVRCGRQGRCDHIDDTWVCLACGAMFTTQQLEDRLKKLEATRGCGPRLDELANAEERGR